jgi:hypothetical protein
MKYLTGKDYAWLCDNCQKAIDLAYTMIVDGLVNDQYADDNEGPCMLAYDRRLMGRCCQ